MSSKATTRTPSKLRICSDFFKPSVGLEPTTPSLPSSDEAGTKGTGGKPRAQKPRKKKKTPENE
jgi:hypothetical protein